MTKAFSTYSLLFAALLFSFYTFVSGAQVVCQSNGCDECCVTSDYCSTEHTLVSEDRQCRTPYLRETPLIPGLQHCPFDFLEFEYESCRDSRVDDRSKSVGEYGKPNWVGAEFQSTARDKFSVTVMWEHTDAEIPSSLPDLSPVQGYEIRIYEREPGMPEKLLQCFCTDPSMRNVSGIHDVGFTYKEMSHMIVEVRTFPSLIGRDESNTRRNCSLLTRCSTIDDCVISRDDCYSWPQNCFNFPSYDPVTCVPPLYNPPVIIKAIMTFVDNSVSVSDAGKLDLSWKPPMMDYDSFPVPDIYYATIESISDSNISFTFKVVNTTNISVLSLNYSMIYRVFIAAYVPCSGLSHNSLIESNVGCGSQVLTTVSATPTPTPTPTRSSTPITLIPTTTTATLTEMTPPVSTNIIVATAVVALSAAVIIIGMFAALITLRRKYVRPHKTKSGMPTLCVNIDIGLQPKQNTNINVFVFYPKNTEHEDEVFIQTYLVATLSKHAEIKEVKSPDDPNFERGHIPESIDKGFRQADFVIIVCNSLFLSEWNCDECSPSVQLLKHYMGNVSIRSDDSISKLITVVLDEQKKQLVSHSRLNLGILKSFMVTESTWENDIQNIVRYMTGTPLFQITTQEHSLAVLDALESPGTPVSDIVPDSSQESHTVTPRTSDSSLSDSNKDDHDIVYTQAV